MSEKEEVRMLEGCMKAFLLEYLRQKKQLLKDDIIINEFPINRYARRVDIVTIGKATHAYEIKSEADSLYRLHGQVETYLGFFDKVTVVAASKHIAHILEMTPPNVAVWEMHDKSVHIIRRGKQILINKPANLTRLMRVPDLARVIRMSGGKSKVSHRDGLAKEAEALPANNLRLGVYTALKERYAKTTAAFWEVVGQGEIAPLHLVALSPTSKEREAVTAREEAQTKVWDAWVKKADLMPDDVFLHHLMKSGGKNPFGPIPTKIRKLVGQG